MRVILIAIISILLSHGAAMAKGPFVAKDAGIRFKSAAISFGLKNMQATKYSCKQAKRFVCQFDTTGQIVLVAVANNVDEPIGAIGLYFRKDSDTLTFFASVGVLIGLLNPEVEIDERQRIAKKLIDGATKGGAVELGSNYTITSSYDSSIGVRVFANFY